MPPAYVLDTNLLIAQGRRNDLYELAQERFDFANAIVQASIASAAELLAFVTIRDWKEERLRHIEDILSNLIIIPADTRDAIDAYAQIAAYSRKVGKHLEQNDIWIAVAARLSNSILLTTDKDFNHLDGVYLKVVWVDPVTKPKEEG